jgi:predicted ATPase
MLTGLRIRNFKAWKDTGDFRLAPLTVIFGGNSAGKSSIGHLLMALKQTAQSLDRRRALYLGDDKSLIDLGTFTECLHQHSIDAPLGFRLAWEPPKKFEWRDPLSGNKMFSADTLTLNVDMDANSANQPEVAKFSYVATTREGEKELTVLDATFTRGVDEKSKLSYELTSRKVSLVRTPGRVWPLDPPEKFYRISEASRARYQNAGFLNDLALALEQALANVFFLGPLRDYPRRLYQWSDDTPEDVGPRGEYSIAAILAARAQGRKLNRGPNMRQAPFDEFIAAWLKDLGLIHSFSVKPVAAGRKEYEVLLQSQAGGSEVKIADVGFGLSPVLPALVEVFYCPVGSTVWMEQPEIQLHPHVQSQLADVFISAIHAREEGRDRRVQLIVESHSEHFLSRLQRRIAEQTVKPEEVAIYFVSHPKTQATLEPLKIDTYGEIENWPSNFFGDEMGDISARTIAAVRRQKSP